MFIFLCFVRQRSGVCRELCGAGAARNHGPNIQDEGQRHHTNSPMHGEQQSVFVNISLTLQIGLQLFSIIFLFESAFFKIWRLPSTKTFICRFSNSGCVQETSLYSAKINETSVDLCVRKGCII